MPFSGPNDSELPEHVQELPEEKREIWVSAWNAAFDRCMNESGEDCEGVAFRIANSAIKDEAETSIPDKAGHSMAETISEVLYAELAALTNGKPFDGFTHTRGGEFVDKFGRIVKIKKSELAQYIKNTKAAIAAATTDSGEVVGLPIDSDNHDHGDAAGFIIDAELADGGDIIRFTPKWTELGLKKIGKSLRRFFSPQFDPVRKVITGGSLTNWIGSLNPKNGNVLLKPIELSQGFFIAETARPEMLEDVAETTTTTEGHVVTATNGGGMLPPKSLKNLSAESTEPEEQQMSDEAIKEIVQKEVEAALRAELARVKGQPVDGDTALSESETVDTEGTAEALLELLGVNGLSDTARESVRDVVLAKGQQMKKQAEHEAMLYMAQIQREDTIDQFCLSATGGEDKLPVGIPYPGDELKALLMASDFETAQKWMHVLATIREKGLTSFEELGHGKRQTGTVELEPPLKKMLTKFIADGGSVSEFFEINASELGVKEQYNLSAFEEKVKEQ